MEQEGVNLHIKNPIGGMNPLHLASSLGESTIVDKLLKKGLDPNGKNREGYTALHYAAYRGDALVVKILLAQRADPSLDDNRGRTPLQLAVSQDHQQVVASFKEAYEETLKETAFFNRCRERGVAKIVADYLFSNQG